VVEEGEVGEGEEIRLRFLVVARLEELEAAVEVETRLRFLDVVGLLEESAGGVTEIWCMEWDGSDSCGWIGEEGRERVLILLLFDE
jgi:hypothetical protein